MDEKKIAEGITTAILEFVKKESKGIFEWVRKQEINILPLNFNVVLSIGYEKNSQSETYYKQLKKEFTNLINSSPKFEHHLVFKDISSEKLFANKQIAEKFRREKELDLIIWGNFSEDGLRDEGKLSNKIELNFTFGHPENEKKEIGEMVKLDIGSRFYVYNNWKINEETSLKDIELISSNMFDISIYIIALTYKLWGRLAESIELFEEIYKRLQKKNSNIGNQIIPHLINCYEQFSLYAIFKKQDFKIATQLFQKVLILQPKNFFALVNLAKVKYELGLVEESYSITKQLLEFYPRNPSVELDVAFHKILKKEYKGAFKHYNRLIAVGREGLDFNPVDVVAFLDKQYQQLKEPALLYAIGIISHSYLEDDISKQSLKQFIAQFKEYSCKEMYRNAQKILKSKMLSSAKKR